MSRFKRLFLGVFCSLLMVSMAVPSFAADINPSCFKTKKEISGYESFPLDLYRCEMQLISLRSSSGIITLDSGKRITWAKAIKSGYIEVDDFNLSGVMVLTEVSKKVKAIIVADDITRIDSKAFSGCSKLISVNFSKSSKLGIVGKYAFAHCTKLKSITFPQHLKVIRGKAFLACINLKQVNISPNTFINESSLPANASVHYY